MLLSNRIGNKRALSNLVAYVLLIAITISLSVMVYGWLKFYVDVEEVEDCPANINIVIEDYECVSGAGGSLTVTLKNKGLFSVDGFVLRVHNREDAEFGFYIFDEHTFGSIEGSLAPGENYTDTYLFSGYDEEEIRTITLVEVQPLYDEVACEAHASQRVTCS